MNKKYRNILLWILFFTIIASPLLVNTIYNYQNNHFTCWNKVYLHNGDITYDALTTYSVMGNSGQVNLFGQLSEYGKKSLYVQQQIPFVFTQHQDEPLIVFTPTVLADTVKKLLEPIGGASKKWIFPVYTFRQGRHVMVLESDGIPIYVCTRV
ncbi:MULTISPECIES: hypothetical protein [unclassified Serratia (in: enterobacteria)]|uniref:hypothetical protein n=1 Tax=unclassified Serratia (in: enterobacteria) TaxID=2647522 RepID=UPI0030763A37